MKAARTAKKSTRRPPSGKRPVRRALENAPPLYFEQTFGAPDMASMNPDFRYLPGVAVELL